MKKILFSLTSLLICIPIYSNMLVWDGMSSDKSWYNGDLSEFHITNAAQLKGFADLVNVNKITFEGKTIVLDNNIDLNGKLWTPIGNGYNTGQIVFKGVFKGEGHSISNVVLNSATNPYGIAAVSDYYCIGFFGVVKEGKLSSLKIEGEVTIENGYGCQNAGGLVGYAYNTSIERIISHFNLYVKQENGYGLLLGGVAGDATTSSFLGVSSSGEVKYYNNARMRKYFGGISGKANSIEECSSDFQILLPASGAENCYIGGLAGYAGTVTDAFFSGSVNVYDYWNQKNVFVGGIVGQSGTSISNVISAPSSFSVQTQTPNLYQGLIAPSMTSSSVINAWFLNGVTSTPGSTGTSITESELKSGNAINGFSEEKWCFKEGEYPSLKILSASEEGVEDDVIDEYGRISGVYYELDPNTQTAKVIYGNIKYTGDVVIKDSIINGGKTYLVTSIGQWAFGKCSDLTSITIPNTIEKIGITAFMDCTSLNTIVLPNTITEIGDQAFEGCTSLKTINLPDGLTSISKGLFFNCNSLESITIPKSVRSFTSTFPMDAEEFNPFEGCSALSSIVVEDGNLVYDSRNNCNAIIESASNKLLCGCKETIIPNSVVEIGVSAFAGCSSLIEITIPNSVKIIGMAAFAQCVGLSNVVIPNNVTEIMSSVFWGCTGLKSVIFPNNINYLAGAILTNCGNLTNVVLPTNIEEIGGSFFSNCTSLTSITIPSSVKTINNYAFNNCASLKTVYCNAEKVPTTTNVVFSETPIQSATLYVPASAIEQYQSATPWSNFGSILSIKKCAKPTISYTNGELLFECETEGVEFNYDIRDEDVKSGISNRIKLSATYQIVAFATKLDYLNSDATTATLCWIDVEPKTEGVTDGVANVRANAVLIQNNGGVLSIQGADENTPVNIYNISGQLVGSGMATIGTTDISTTLRSGDVGIVKIGEKAVKVRMQ